jgi:hypothetical protein
VEQGGYDQVIGCPAVSRDEASLQWLTVDVRFKPSSISGDGRVVGGDYNGFPGTWKAPDSFTQLNSESQLVEELSCDGSFILLGHEYDGSVWRIGPAGTDAILAPAEQNPLPLALSPDGGTVVTTLSRPMDLGPNPVRWTPSAGLEPIAPLLNTLVYRTGNGGQWLVGGDIRQIYRYEPGVGKTELSSWPAYAPAQPPTVVVSADGSAYAFSTATGFGVVRNGNATYITCADSVCEPIDISGTGKVVLVYSGYGSIPISLVYTTEHGLRNLTELLEEHGEDAAGRSLVGAAMSDDGQAFAGSAYDTETFEQHQFYATLPLAAYE